MVEAPGVEPGALVCFQGVQGLPGYMRDTLRIKRGLSPIVIVNKSR